ncbi:MAG TPA: hypothetical protein VKQ28_16800 [Candidatus Acidoferrum sp.]|nr:hypothetical protein [Candidatus Acidoferrum sp.]
MEKVEQGGEKQTFPEHFPPERQELWHKTYADAMEQSKVDAPEGAFHTQTAKREANRHLRVPVLKSYADAMKLERWQYKERKTLGADRIAALGHDPQGPGEHLAVVTIDGKKYFFAVPGARRAEVEGASEAAGAAGQGGGAKDGGKK